MKVENTNRELKRKLLRKERQEIQKKDERLERLKHLYKERLKKVKSEGEIQVQNQLIKNEKRLQRNREEINRRLLDLQQNFNKTQKMLEEEEQAMNEDLSYKLQAKVQKNKENIENLKNEQIDILGDIRQRSADDFNKVEQKNHEVLQEIQQKFNHKSTSTAITKQQELESLKDRFENQKILRDSKYKSVLKQDELEHNNKVNLIKKTQKNEINKLKEEHQKRYEYQSKEFKRKIKESNEDFTKKYASIVNAHLFQIKNLTNRTKKDIDKIKSQLAHQKQKISDKANDKFYHINFLEPKITEEKNYYKISITVPEYELDYVHLSGSGRKLKLTQTRNYKDEIIKQDGSYNKYSKAESYSKDFNVADIIEPNSMTKVYKDGILTFTVKKA